MRWVSVCNIFFRKESCWNVSILYLSTLILVAKCRIQMYEHVLCDVLNVIIYPQKRMRRKCCYFIYVFYTNYGKSSEICLKRRIEPSAGFVYHTRDGDRGGDGILYFKTHNFFFFLYIYIYIYLFISIVSYIVRPFMGNICL